MNDINKTYDPQEIETPLYQHWENSGYFKPSGDTSQDPYCIMIPPPNVTGSLHMGHAFQDTIMDTLIRYQRMKGKNTLWQVGTDHAGIATQMVVERQIAANGETKEDYGRQEFIKKIWEWKEHSGGTITKQLRRLGASVDWDRERFTMDDGLSNAVQEVFIRLYNDGLIYRGKRLVNWDPKLFTAISDLEVENKEKNGSMWYFRYPLADGKKTSEGNDYIVVATTRPETMLGDTGVAVNPEDPRYKDLIGCDIELPIVGRRIPIVGDEHADMEKGTGCVKITPAHDFNDNEVGKRCGLAMINIFTFSAHVREEAEVLDTNGEPTDQFDGAIPERYQGLERFKARKAVVTEFEELGLLEKIEPHTLSIPYGDRGGVVIEPMLTDQWYVRSEPLAKPAIEAVENGDIKFVPQQYENMYFSWMRNIQDWCISRQLWWGHRIPAWYDDNGNIYVAATEEEVRTKHNLSADIALRQDDDVLDTWFSSALWTFSTLGWPEETPELKTYHPTDVLVTGFDIIPFWVARMIMMTLYFIKDEDGTPQVPFKTVYVTGLIRDENGDKMSKSKGNVLDPLDMIDGIELEDLVAKRCSNMMQPQLAKKIEKQTRKEFADGIAPFGTDALRFTLAALASTGRNINWDMQRLEGYRNFCTKIWNASRYVMMNVEGKDCGFDENGTVADLEYSNTDKWIQVKLNETIREFTHHLDEFRFDLASKALYDFVWNEFCDWYIELTKPVLKNGSEAEQRATRNMLMSTLETVLRLAHPIIPFITEEIWKGVKSFIPSLTGDSLMLQAFPLVDESLNNDAVVGDVEWLKQVIGCVRNIRAEYNISPSQQLNVFLKPADNEDQRRLDENREELMFIARLETLDLFDPETAPTCASALAGKSEVMVPMSGLIDKDEELARIDKEIKNANDMIKRIQGKLSNENFVSKAPAAVVDKEKAKITEFEASLEKLNEMRKNVEAM